MTYKDLALKILALEQEQQDTDVTVRINQSGEYFPAFGFAITEETDILDTGHPFLTVNL